MPFYKSLADSPLRKSGSFRLLAVSNEDAAATTEYLERNRVFVDQVVSERPPNTRVRGTPTLVLVDRKATVEKAWMGHLTKTAEDEVLKRLAAGGPS